MPENKFYNSKICSIKIKEINDNLEDFYGKSVYRVLKHGIPVNKFDFYPSIMTGNNYKMPSFDKQLDFEVDKFGVSVFLNVHKMVDFLKGIPTFNNIHYISVGTIKQDKGCSGLYDNSSTHLEYFLYDADGNNPFVDFIIFKENK